MVHALEECWRVLVPGGYLIDTRPLSGEARVDIIEGSKAKFAGLVDDTIYIPDDEASKQALETVIQKGLFLKEEETEFIFFYYWDTLEQARAYTQEKWVDAHLPEAVWHRAEDIIKQSEGSVRIRISFRNLFCRYRKLDSP